METAPLSAPPQKGFNPEGRASAQNDQPAAAARFPIEQPAAYNPLGGSASLTDDAESVEQSPGGYIKKYVKIIKWGVLVLLIFAVLVMGAWGQELYEKYFKEVATEEILPGDSDFVAKIVINPESQQFQLLEKNMEKFPGYRLLKKELDKAGEGKTLSQAFQDKIKELNLDFQDDIKPVLGDNAYILIPDLNPLGETLNEGILFSAKSAGEYMKGLAQKEVIPQNVALVNESLAQPKIMGETRDLYVSEAESKSKVKALDFIAASEIKDLKKAKEVLDKMKKDEKYQMTELNYKGYPYFKLIVAKESATKNEVGKYFNYQQTYHCLLGKNWVMASSEDALKKMIAARKQEHLLTGMFNEEGTPILAQDKDFQEVMANLESKEESLLSLYYKVNFNELFKKDCAGKTNCESLADYIRYPENMIAGYKLTFTPDGVAIKSTSNGVNLDKFQNKPLKNSLATKVPYKIDGRWGDVFAEYFSWKDLYYSFKKNNLTSKGIDEWNDTLTAIKNGTGINLENDFIDLISGNVAWMMYSKKDLYPAGVMVAEINDGAKMVGTMRKAVEFIKAMQLARYSYVIDGGNDFSAGLTPEQSAMVKKYEAEQKARVEKIQQSQLIETESPYGKIYSYKIPDSDLSFDFSVEGNQFVLATHYAAVEGILKEQKTPTEKKLAETDQYKQVETYYFDELFSDVYIVPQGVWNAIEYFMTATKNAALAQQQEYCKQFPAECGQSDFVFSGMDEGMAAASAFFRTVKVVTTCSALSGKYSNAQFYMKIESLAQEEKDKAEKIMEGVSEGITTSREKALNASMQSTMASATTAASICQSEGGTVTQPEEGKPICTKSDIVEEWPTLPQSLKDAGYSWGSLNGDTLTGLRQGKEVFRCSLSTGSCMIVS